MTTEQLEVALLHVPKPVHLTPEHGVVSFVNFPAFGLFSMASALGDAGFSTQIVHVGLERLRGELADLPGYLRRRGTRIVGISLHWHPSTFDALWTARWLKRELPDVQVVLGGITASYFAAQCFGFEGVDFVIEGDGERALVAFATALLRSPARALSTVPNLWHRGADGAPVPPVERHADTTEDLARYDFACFERVKNGDLLKYLNWAMPAEAPWLGSLMRVAQHVRPNLRPFTLYLGRGCPIACPICGGNARVMRESFSRKGFHAIPPERLVRLAERALAAGFTHLVSDMGLGIDDEHLVALFTALEESKLAPRFSLSSPTIPSLAVARALKRGTNGNCWLSLTAETGSEPLRQRFRGAASFTNRALLEFLASTDSEGIPTQVVFSRNLPLDPASAVVHERDTAALKHALRRIRSVTPVNYSLQLDPGSPMFHDPARFDCVPLWRTLRDYYDANRVADAGPGFTTAVHPERRWGRQRTAQLEMIEARVLAAGLRIGGRIERTGRRWLGAAVVGSPSAQRE